MTSSLDERVAALMRLVDATRNAHARWLGVHTDDAVILKRLAADSQTTRDELESAIRAALAAAEDAALERVADECEKWWRAGYRGDAEVGFAYKVRALKGKPR